MRIGFSCKEIAAILGIHVQKVTQSIDPTLDKMAHLWVADPTKTMLMLMDAVDQMHSGATFKTMRQKTGRNMPANMIRERANAAVAQAIRAKKMRPESCRECGSPETETEAHHPDYRYPLSVIWLCKSCHAKVHKSESAA